MGRRRQDQQKSEKVKVAEKMPPEKTAADADEQEEPLPPPENIGTKPGGGARKALRRAVKSQVKGHCLEIAGTLVNKARAGDGRCAALVASMIEKKKLGDDGDWEGPSMAELFGMDQNEKEEKQEANTSK